MSGGTTWCGRCEKGAPEKKVLGTKFTDFTAIINHHCVQLQRRLVLEYQQVVGQHVRQQEEAFEEASNMWPPLAGNGNRNHAPTAHFSQSYHAGARAPGGAALLDYVPASRTSGPREAATPRANMPSSTWRESRSLLLTGPACASKALALPATLRALAEEQDHALQEMLSTGAACTQLASSNVNGSADRCVVEEPPMDPTTGGETFNIEGFNTDASMLGTVATSSLPKYTEFELLPTWLEQGSYTRSLKIAHSSKVRNIKGCVSQAEFSEAAIRRSCVVSPGSTFTIWWNLLFMVVLFYELVIFPMSVFDIDPTEGVLSVFAWLAILFWSSDFVLSFFVGYYTKEGALIMDRMKIVRHYTRSWMLADFTIIAVDWIGIIGADSEQGGVLQAAGFLRIGKALRYFRVLRVLRVLRLRKLREAVRSLDEFVNSKYFTVVRSIVLNMFGIVLTSHFIGCMWYFIGSTEFENEKSWVTSGYDHFGKDYKYLTSLHWSLTQFTPGSMSVQPQNVVERAFAVIVLLFGMIIFSSIVSSITAATNSLKNINARYDKQVWTLRRYFREQNITPELLARVIRYSDSVIKQKEQHVSLREVELLHRLPQSLYMDVMLEIYDEVLEEHPLFLNMNSRNKRLMQKLCCSAVQEIILAQEDELFGPGQTAHHMYFVSVGRLTYHMDHAETFQAVAVEAKNSFCEAVLWTYWVHQGRMHSGKESELVAVGSTEFQKVVELYQTELFVAKKYGAEFVRGMNDLAGLNNGDEEDDTNLSDILAIPSAVALLSNIDNIIKCANLPQEA
mmetsp:Transcript_31593/g.87144  ORF Transcript_31593/g.87144 Transcript_31593/m.87144 type:complete len:791 (-) Transcript_31593:158-2530(-)|eukprot:CAMPEP_0117514404 /NCGR_PEP_ID=MMETSP0784-20121206/30051_1 /TAXON_ID=39447 /ORGANISM="" /LENGTH=790 /DNA_ID=CAMNT_0005310197 /DNA_START=57 /DNA_END=2429 /DNA_ORIENTATION=+